MKTEQDQDRMFSIEQSMIAALLVNPEAILDHMDALYPSQFANPSLERIYV